MQPTTLLRLTLKSTHPITFAVDTPFHVKHYPPGVYIFCVNISTMRTSVLNDSGYDA